MWVSGLIAPSGPPGLLLDAVRRRHLLAIMTWALAEEIAEVLERPELTRYDISVGDVTDLLSVIGPMIPAVEISIAPRDPDDAHIIAAAVAGGADALVTGGKGLIDDTDLRGWLEDHHIELLTPIQLAQRLTGA